MAATLPGLVKALEDAARRARDLSSPLDEFGGSVLKAAAPRAPRLTGLLAGSPRARASAGRLDITSPVRYFAPVHNGRTRRGKVRARPWLAEALAASNPNPVLEAHVLEPLERI